MKPTKLWGMGGMQEIGKSTLGIEHNDKIFVLDCGIKFMDAFTTGIKGSIPDFEYLKQNTSKVQGVFITHGHEDHIGGVPYLVQQVDVKRVYAPRIAIQYLKLKFADLKIKNDIEFFELEKDSKFVFDDVVVDVWTAQHSIPDAFGIRFTTPNGSIMCTGDFRFDYTPIGNLTDFTKLEQMGKEGLDILLSDSTNAMRPNHSPSEKDILSDIESIMLNAKRKIIVTAFASNLTRIKAIIELGAKLNKKVVAFGRSMTQGIQIGRRLGYIDAPDEIFIDKKHVKKFDENELLILTTGSQGEELAGLAKMSFGKHPQIEIKKDDVIIFSSSPIPGNRSKIELLVNRLYKLGAIIKENGVDGYLHTSGHAYKDEHITIFNKTKPKYFMPYHGEYRMSVVHGHTATECGVPKENIIIAKLGEVYELKNHKVTLSNEKIHVGPVFIDGEIVSKINSNIIKERTELGTNGFVHVIIAINKQKKIIHGRPRIVSRGAFYVKNSTELLDETKRLVHSAVLYTIRNKDNWTIPELKQLIKDRLEPYFYKEKRRNVVVLSTILLVNENTKKTKSNHKTNIEKKPKKIAKKDTTKTD
ncbi:ribonuclease J [Mycoplasma phocoenae]|uniref:Ribonuclease J n=1 Tax=Mycoplasma phocoenae TaxID=754517 RepID=A0A858U6A6_9MOLU|nr:ribonuclease J [Mycoplasma phocoenae]QJG66763.1 ribonuclease J [Mycoplasma phocoenae]